MNKVYKNYFYIVLISIATIFFLVVSINRLIDPYSYFHDANKKEFNFLKPYIPTTRAKALAIAEFKPKVLILGSSRTEQGIDPNNDAWKMHPVFNAAFGGADIFDSYHYLKFSHSSGQLKEVVLMVDFFMFNAERKKYDSKGYGYLENISQSADLLTISTFKYLLSLQTTIDSFKTKLNKVNKSRLIKDKGLLSVPQLTHPYSKFISTESAFYKVHYRDFKTKNDHQDNMQAFLWIIDFVRENDINLIVGISPIHARLLEVLYVKDYGNEFEEWKRNLLKMIEAKRVEGQKNNITLIDYSGFNYFTTEAIPGKDITQESQLDMKWYLEPSHYKLSLGNKVIDKFLSQKVSAIGSFGFKLNQKNIEGHLKKIKEERKKWKEKFPEYSKEIGLLSQ
ncbi:MAG: hypothetical protein ACJ0GU_04035 [Gammaproteobacteria bacterium]|nr:MAG: hypothetical protein EVA53_03765 [Gammaproteobacteria bacterium]